MKNTILFLLGLLLVSCGPRREEGAKEKPGLPLVSAVNYPLFYFAERIGGELIQVVFPAPADVDPAYWTPDDEALAVYQSSDLILANGAEYARWMQQVSLPSSRVINTSAKVKDKYVEVMQEASHSHGPGGEHVHTGYAFTTWLDFQLALVQSEAIKEALLGILPDQKKIIYHNYLVLERELLALHDSMTELSAKLGEESILGSHPVYQYLSAAYGLHIHSLHFEPGDLPSEAQWKEFDTLLATHPARMMLWEAEPLPEVREILLGKGIHPLVFNPCGNRPAGGDFMEVMNENIENFVNPM